jgi:hypothetical protein
MEDLAQTLPSHDNVNRATNLGTQTSPQAELPSEQTTFRPAENVPQYETDLLHDGKQLGSGLVASNNEWRGDRESRQ